MNANRQTAPVLNVPIDIISWNTALLTLNTWANNHESRYVCICNVHSVVTATQNAAFGAVVKNADMATPDGAPVAWLMRKLGAKNQQRINGPDLMWKYCEQSQNNAVLMQNAANLQNNHQPDNCQLDNHEKATSNHNNGSMFFYGSTEATLATLQIKLLASFPDLNIAGAISPPFRTLSPAEDAAIIAQINHSGAGIVWVSLGCPKQELWMATHRGSINAVMVGVGAAFDYHAGTIKRAPKWMQHNGLEWLHRLVSEPKRLWKRYLVTNTLFVIGVVKQLF